MDGWPRSVCASQCICVPGDCIYVHTDMLHFRASRLASRHYCGKCIQTILHMAAEMAYILSATASVCESRRGEARREELWWLPRILSDHLRLRFTPVTTAQTTRFVFYKSLC